VANRASVDKGKVCLPALHIKLKLIKMLVKQTDKESERFAYLWQKIPKISKAKIHD